MTAQSQNEIAETIGPSAVCFFSGTLIRCTVNRLEKLHAEHSLDDVSAVLGEFAASAARVAALYGGAVLEARGGDLLFYFKDQDRDDSTALAFAALRDLRAWAFALPPRALHFRAAVTHGSLRLGALSSASRTLHLLGEPLLEADRILSSAPEFDQTVIVCNKRLTLSRDGLMTFGAYQASQGGALALYEDHRNCDDFLRGADHSRLSRLRYYRAEEHLLKVLRAAQSAPDADFVLGVIRVLREHPAPATGVVAEVLLAWLEDLAASVSTAQQTAMPARIFSAALRLIENLASIEESRGRVQLLLNRALEADNRRVISNALEVMIAVCGELSPEISEKLVRHADPRVAANALIREGVRALSPLVIERLKKMLSSRNADRMASALFALGELAQHYRANHTSDRAELWELFDWVRALATHDDAKVRRQAWIAARKAGDKVLSERILSAVSERGDQLRVSEARECFAPQVKKAA